MNYEDIDGTPHRLEASGYLAGVFQHELDHLDGVLYIVSTSSSFSFLCLLASLSLSLLPVLGQFVADVDDDLS